MRGNGEHPLVAVWAGGTAQPSGAVTAPSRSRRTRRDCAPFWLPPNAEKLILNYDCRNHYCEVHPHAVSLSV